jgi:hypothetical protein
MKRHLVPLLLLFCLQVAGQATEFSGYNWSTFASAPVNDTVKAVNGSVITLDRRITEVYINKDDFFEEINVFHRKIRVLTHDAINNFNKIYIPVNNVIEVLAVRARFISHEGKITELSEGSIHEVENLENKGNYQTFAIEGAETGGEIEYYYILRKKFDPYGSLSMQGEEPRANVDVIFAFPSKLEYQIKTYNGFPDFTSKSDTTTKLTYLRATASLIPSLASENYATYKACLMRFEYTLAYNHYKSLLRVYSYSTYSSNMYGNLYEFTKAEKSEIKSVLKKLDISNLETLKKVWKMENWMKTEIAISDELKTTPSIDQMVKLKQTTKYGATRLMIGLLSMANLNFELVATCDVNERVFDPDYNGWNFLDDYLIYFPDLHKFIQPDNPTFRIGIHSSDYQGAYGLFMHPLLYGDKLRTLAYDIRKLPIENYEQNTDSLLIHLRFNLDEKNLDAKIHRVFTGQLAASYQSFWRLANEERQNSIISAIFNMGTHNTRIISCKLNHDTPSDIAISPLSWDVDLTANSLVEQAGDDIIVKIGETIGEQSELYQQTTRRLPVIVNSVHNYYRRIIFDIPAGYAVTNLNDLRMKVEMMNNGKVSCCFTSWYEISENKLVIYSKEYYTEEGYPVGRFEDFRKVINAAADFNKRTIILSKGQL